MARASNDMESKRSKLKTDDVNTAEKVKDAEKKKTVDLDMILVEDIGEFGIYQFRTVSIVAVIVIFVAWATNEYVFTAARIPSRCFIPECDLETPEFHASWIEYAIPILNNGFDNCNRFAANLSTDGSCSENSFNQDEKVPCQSYIYENMDTVVYDFSLACEDWSRSLIGSACTLGTLLSLPLTGYVSDRWGRRTALTITAFNTAWLGIIRYWAKTYIGFVISVLLESTFGSGSFTAGYILVMELMGPKYRVAAGAAMNMFFSIGKIIMALLAWIVPNWRKLTLVLYVPQLITVFCYFVMFESVRWYMSEGRYEESEEVLKKVAKINKKQLSEQSLKSLGESAEEAKRKKESEKSSQTSEPWLFMLVFHYKPILLRCVVSPFWWITMTFVFYGMSINSVNLSGNANLNYIAVSVVEIPGYWTAVLLMGKIGRKAVLTLAYWVCAVCQFGYIFTPPSLASVSLILYLIGQYSIAMVMTSVYVYTAELYPTRYRNSLVAFSSMIGRIGSILAPLTPALGETVWVGLPNTIFGSMALISGLLVFLTPETLGSKLPDTIEEACAIGKKKDKDLKT